MSRVYKTREDLVFSLDPYDLSGQGVVLGLGKAVPHHSMDVFGPVFRFHLNEDLFFGQSRGFRLFSHHFPFLQYGLGLEGFHSLVFISGVFFWWNERDFEFGRLLLVH